MNKKRVTSVSLGLIGFTVIAIIQLLPQKIENSVLFWTMVSFALALPGLVFSLAFVQFKLVSTSSKFVLDILLSIFALSAIIDFIGISALFFHFGYIVGNIFFWTSAIAFLSFIRLDEKRQEKKNSKTKHKKKNSKKDKLRLSEAV